MKSIFVSGYRSYELNIFNQTDPKLFYLKEFLKSQIIHYLENGVEWFIITGQLGIELWTGEIVNELKEEYPEIKLGVLLPYTSFGEKWNEVNKDLFERVIHQADYVNYTSNKEYMSPKQLKANQIFTVRNTDGALLIYDTMVGEAAEGKPKYVYDLILKYQEQSPYDLNLVAFEEIEFFIHEFTALNENVLKDRIDPESVD